MTSGSSGDATRPAEEAPGSALSTQGTKDTRGARAARNRFVVLFVLMALVALISYFESDAARYSIANPSNPYAAQLPPADAAPPLTGKVVLLLQDGLRDDLARTLPNMSRLARRSDSAFHRSLTGVPSLSVPGRVAVLCGTGPDVSGIPLNESRGAADVECLFQTVASAGKESIAIGIRPGFQRRYQTPATKLVESRPEPFEHAPEEDPLRFGPALRELSSPASFVYVDLTDYDSNAHEHGAFSPQALLAATRFDEFVGAVADRLDFNRDTLIVTSDHGHVDAGGHGGYELLARQSPLLLVGQGVSGQSTIDVSQTDIAPTVAALIGVPRPRDSRGNPILGSLTGPPATLVAIERTQEAALIRRLEAELGYIAGKPTAPGTPEVLINEIAAVRWRKGLSEALRRIPLAIGVVVLVVVLAWLARGLKRQYLLAASALGGCVALAMMTIGFEGSISFFNTPSDEPLFLGAIVAGAGAGLFLGGLAVGLGSDSSAPGDSAARSAVSLTSAVFFLAGLVVSGYVLWYGSRYTWRLPDLRVALVAAIAMTIPLVTVLLFPLTWLGVSLGRRGGARR